jgi:D-3-phosphoglycerate dehydrogenase / 2-oxoglutarate reductase
MKIGGIGDLFIPEKYIKEGFKEIKHLGVYVETIQWEIEKHVEFQNINLLVEKYGHKNEENNNVYIA